MHFDCELKQDLNGDEVRILHVLLLLDLNASPSERNSSPFGVGTPAIVTRLQRESGLEPSGCRPSGDECGIAKALDRKGTQSPGPSAAPIARVSTGCAS